MGNKRTSAQSWFNHVVIVKLPPEPQTDNELETITQVAMNSADFDVVIDFAEVSTISKRAICNLVILQRLLHKSFRHLGFSNVNHTLKETFVVHRIGSVIESDWSGEIGLEPQGNRQGSGTLVFENQDRTEVYERRNYTRLNLSQSLQISVELWPVCQASNPVKSVPADGWQGVLIDVSEGGAQVAIDFLQKATIKCEQFIRMRFAPIVYESPITVDAMIREILPTVDSENVCLGLQFVGLAANPEAQRVLNRLCDSEKRYFETSVRNTSVSLMPSVKG